MAEDNTDTSGEDSSKVLDVAFKALVVAGVLAVAFLAWDAFTSGGATDTAVRFIAGLRPGKTGTVTPLRKVEDDGEQRSSGS